MAITQDQQEILQALSDLIKRSSGGQSRAYPEMKGKTDGSSAAQEMLDAARKNSETLKTIETSFKKVTAAALKGLNSAELEKLPAAMRKTLEESGDKYAKQMADSIKTVGDVVQAQKQLVAQKTLVSTLKEYSVGQEISLEEFKKLEIIAKEAGVSVGRFIDANTKTIKGLDKLEAETDDLSTAFDKAAVNATKNSRSLNVLTTLYGQHSAKLRESLKLFVEETRIARERGTWDAKYIDAVVGLGVTMKDWQTTLAENRNVQQAMAAGGRDFTAEITAGSKSLLQYSKDNVQAMQTTAQFSKNIAGFGVKQENLGGALDEQVKLYEDNFRIYGVTAEAFGKSTEALLADTDIRHNLSMMAEKERKQYILGIQAQEASRLALGYTTAEARELTKVFASMGAESPKDRMKKAAKMRALAGSMGMGAEGAELQKIMVNINQLEGDAKADAIKRAEEIQRNMANKIKERYGQSLGAEMVTRRMVDASGFNELSKQLETLSREGRTIDPDAEKANQSNREVPELLSKSIGIWDSFNALQGTSVGLLTSILAVLVAQSLGKGVVGKFTGPGAPTTKMGAAKTAGKIAGKIAAPIAALASGVFKYMEVVDDEKLSTGQKTAQVGSTAAGAGLGAIGGGMAGAAIGTAILPVVGTIIGGLIGSAIGAWGGEAVGEVVGEGLSSLMDSPATQQATAEKVAKKEAGMAPKEDAATVYEKTAEKQNVQNELLLTAVKEMTVYIKDINTQNNELAGSTKNLATQMNESNRSANLNAPRPA